MNKVSEKLETILSGTNESLTHHVLYTNYTLVFSHAIICMELVDIEYETISQSLTMHNDQV